MMCLPSNLPYVTILMKRTVQQVPLVSYGTGWGNGNWSTWLVLTTLTDQRHKMQGEMVAKELKSF